MSLGQRRPVQVEVTEQDKNDALFFDAVLKGDMKQAKWFFDKGADIRKPSGAHTPLRAASLNGHVHMVKWLVDDLGVSPKEDPRALLLVSLSAKPSQELFMYLAERGASVTLEDEKLGTPLTMALQQGHDDFAKWMIEKYGLAVDEQGKSLEKSTPLHKACGHCTPQTVEYLLERGAKVSLTVEDAQRQTPLMIAVKEKKADVVELLLRKYGVDPNVCTDTSALFIAVQDGYVPCTKVLLENGADANLWHPEMKVNPLHIAASNDHVFVVRELLRHGARVDCVSGKGYTPLIMACSQGYTETPRALLEAGADVNYICPSDGATAVHHAATGGFLACAQVLLQWKPNLTIADRGGMTPAQCVDEMLKDRPKDAGLLRCRDLFATADLDAKEKCAACFKKLEKPLRCGQCKAVVYCSADCQKKNWPDHKKVCVKK